MRRETIMCTACGTVVLCVPSAHGRPYRGRLCGRARTHVCALACKACAAVAAALLYIQPSSFAWLSRGALLEAGLAAAPFFLLAL